MSLTNAQDRALRRLMLHGVQPAGVGSVRRVHRALVAKGLARWVNNDNIAARCTDDDADLIIANKPEAIRALKTG